MWIALFAAAWAGDLAADLDRLLDAPHLARSPQSVVVAAVADGRTLYERDADALLVAASVTKTWTAAAALERLGPDHVVTTRLVAAGPIEGGALRGDLVLVGAGDPTLGAGDPAAWLDRVAATLLARGVTAVEGDVVADGRAFGRQRLGRGWAWDDALWSYAAPVSALTLHGNLAVIDVLAGEAPGEPVSAAVGPLPSCVPLDLRTTTGDPPAPADFWVDRAPGSTATVLGGTLSPGERRRLTVTVPDPDTCAAVALTNALERAGIGVGGVTRVASAQDPVFTGEILVEVASPPLAELLRPMLVDSDNLIAETVARWLDPAPTGRSFEGAEPVIRDVLRRAGVADEAVVLADGSGLSRYGLVSAEALYRLFRWAPRQSWGPLWMELLPAAGRDGTLARRMAGGPAEGRARGKTGSMTGVYNLAAYVPGPDGDVVVVLLSNGVVARREAARTTQDIAVERVAADLADPPRRRRR